MSKKKEEMHWAEKVLASMGIVVLSILGVIWNGVIFKTAWGWWIVPHFGVRPLVIPEAIAFGFIIAWLKHDGDKKQNGIADTYAKLWASFLVGLFVLGVLWLLRLWM